MTDAGIDSISMDMKEKKLTIIGTVDPVNVVSKLRKYWPTADLVAVGPAKEPEKKEEPKKEEPKRRRPKRRNPRRRRSQRKRKHHQPRRRKSPRRKNPRRKKRRK